MPIEWYLMKQPTYNSGFEGDEFANYAQDGFEEILESELADDIEIFEKTPLNKIGAVIHSDSH